MTGGAARPTRRAVLALPVLLALPRPARARAAAQPVGAYEELLAEEHAAIHLYGILAPRLPDSLRDAARAAFDDHRRHRDQLVAAIQAAGGTPPPPRLSYGLPAPVSTAAAARALAVRIEDSLALRWHAALADAPPKERVAVATALGDECVHLTTYRFAAGVDAAQAAPPFPGR